MTNSNPQIFICHASRDRAKAELLVESLEADGISCWVAPRDVPAGQRYAAALLEAIDACDVFLVVFSEHADSSPHVPNEIENGASRSKPILLVKTDSTEPHANELISLFVASHQWFDASVGQLEDHMERIGADVKHLLERARAKHAKPPSAAAPAQPEPAAATAVAKPSARATKGIGIEIGATKIRGCVVDLAAPSVDLSPESQYFESVATPANPRTVLDQTKEMLERMLGEHCRDSPPAGIGIAVPGQVDLRVGTLKFGPNLFGARNVPFRTYLSSAFPGIPVRVDNEVRCATRFELHLGTGRDFENFVCVFIGTGVGSGTVVDRRIYFGHNFCAGEVGHIKIATTGPPCACGQIGCLETFVKAQAIVSRAEAKAIDWQSRELKTLLAEGDGKLDPKAIVRAIDQGDEAAREVASEVGEDLGLGIANYLNLVNPAAVVIGGGLMNGFFFPMIDSITAAMQGNALAEVANTPIVQSAHSEESIAIGAALLFSPEDDWPF